MLALAFVASCDAPPKPVAKRAGNVLLIVADDVGQDMVGAYAQHPDHPPTPTIDALAARGVLFENAYAEPWCSPTRATILTGRYGFRTGVGIPLVDARERGLPDSEITLPELLHERVQGGVASALVGKWHLGIGDGDACDPRRQGFDHFFGTAGNIARPNTFFRYTKIEDGERRTTTRYATTEQVDDALRFVRELPEPWFVELCFNAAHEPLHAPPRELHDYELAGDPDQTQRAHYCAAVQALDRETGRLLASIAPDVLERTTVIFLGDNGTPNEVVTPPAVRSRSKGMLYEGGVRVPLVIAGRGVSAHGERCTALVNTVDLFTTIAELFGVPASELPSDRPIDGVSLCAYLREPAHAALRRWAYSDKFWPNGAGPYESMQRAIRDERWKLMSGPDEVERFFDLRGRVVEGPDLLLGALDDEQRSAYETLKRELAQLITR